MDKKSKDAFAFLLKAIVDGKIIDDVCSTYTSLCDEESVKKLGLETDIIDEENIKRILFEVLCFGVFLLISQSPKFIEENDYLKDIPGDESYQFFNENLLFALRHYLEKENISSLREIILQSIEPTIQFGYGEPINAVKRVDSYIQSFSIKPGKELDLFGKNIGIAINPPHWPLIDTIGATHAVYLVEATNIIMKSLFE